MIKPNEGKLDRIVRICIGIILVGAAAMILHGTIQIVAVIIGIAALITGTIGYCGLYSILGINTCNIKSKQ